ncbi:conserved hypothetical protein [uncultured Desulfobacterium sp.]|uniref:Uncharacterized protein n=1 Tax=uncultured Desulfobacterium sp. TaxID=201089 RepID=A0A445MU44_9BACT|nr:conserved hypothetical protein [uncultured Desulfobacterium sp.]
MDITINTGLDGFIFVDKIHMMDAGNIQGTRRYTDAPIYLGIESLAQLGAYHVRFLTEFEKHAFLLKINMCGTPSIGKLNGAYSLSGKLISRSSSAFSYMLCSMQDGIIRFEGEFLFATTDYDNIFKKEILQVHYRDLLSCLKSDLKSD